LDALEETWYDIHTGRSYQDIPTAAEVMDGEMPIGFVSKNPSPGPLYSEMWDVEDGEEEFGWV